MSGLLSQLGINQEEFNNIEEEKVPEGYTKESGVYDVAVDTAYIRKTDSGAKMLEVTFKMADDSNHNWSTCIASGDEKGNKSTWTVRDDHAESTKTRYGVGTEVPLPGVVEMRHLLDAIKTPDPAASEGQVKHRDDTITALCLTGIQGKRLKIGLRQEENFYNGEVSIRNHVQYWMDDEGKNGKGEDILEKATAWLAKNPLKKLRGANATAATTAPQGEAPAAGSGW